MPRAFAPASRRTPWIWDMVDGAMTKDEFRRRMDQIIEAHDARMAALPRPDDAILESEAQFAAVQEAMRRYSEAQARVSAWNNARIEVSLAANRAARALIDESRSSSEGG